MNINLRRLLAEKSINPKLNFNISITNQSDKKYEKTGIIAIKNYTKWQHMDFANMKIYREKRIQSGEINNKKQEILEEIFSKLMSLKFHNRNFGYLIFVINITSRLLHFDGIIELSNIENILKGTSHLTENISVNSDAILRNSTDKKFILTIDYLIKKTQKHEICVFCSSVIYVLNNLENVLINKNLSKTELIIYKYEISSNEKELLNHLIMIKNNLTKPIRIRILMANDEKYNSNKNEHAKILFDNITGDNFHDIVTNGKVVFVHMNSDFKLKNWIKFTPQNEIYH